MVILARHYRLGCESDETSLPLSVSNDILVRYITLLMMLATTMPPKLYIPCTVNISKKLLSTAAPIGQIKNGLVSGMAD